MMRQMKDNFALLKIEREFTKDEAVQLLLGIISASEEKHKETSQLLEFWQQKYFSLAAKQRNKA